MKNELNLIRQKEAMHKKETEELSDTLQQERQDWSVKELQLKNQIESLTMENSFCKKEKTNQDSTIKEMKSTIKDLKIKLQAEPVRNSSEKDFTAEKAQMSEEMEKLKTELEEKDSQIIEHELSM